MSGERRSALSWVTRALLAWSVLEVTAFGALVVLAHVKHLRYQPRERGLAAEHAAIIREYLEEDGGYLIFIDPELGWTERPGIEHNGSGFTLHVNQQGVRGTREYAERPAEGVVRMAAFGDSFTAGYEVDDEQTWERALERRVSSTEVINYGVGAYGLDQTYLRYQKQGQKLHPSIVFIGYFTDNVDRDGNVFRPFLYPEDKIPLAKPRFVWRGDQLQLIPNPLPSLDRYRELLANPQPLLEEMGRYDDFYQTNDWATAVDLLPSARLIKLVAHSFRVPETPYTTPRARVTLKIFEAFYDRVKRDGSTPFILLFPTKGEVDNVMAGGDAGYAPLRSQLTQRGFAYLDVSRPLAAAKKKDLFRPGGHPSAEANELIADALAAELRKRGLVR